MHRLSVHCSPAILPSIDINDDDIQVCDHGQDRDTRYSLLLSFKASYIPQCLLACLHHAIEAYSPPFARQLPSGEIDNHSQSDFRICACHLTNRIIAMCRRDALAALWG